MPTTPGSVGGPADDGHEDPGAALDLGLQWRTTDHPGGLTTAWSAALGAQLDAGDPGAADDPDRGVVPCVDPGWRDAVAVLADDAEFLRRRARVAGIGLHVVVRDTDEATLAPYPAEGPTSAVVLSQPAADYRDDGGDWLDAAGRLGVYVDAVATLVVETGAALGLDGDDGDDGEH